MTEKLKKNLIKNKKNKAQRAVCQQDLKDKVLQIILENGTENTKYIAKKLDIPISVAYKICTELLAENKISKYGYQVKDGWEDPNYSTQHFRSLTWQINP